MKLQLLALNLMSSLFLAYESSNEFLAYKVQAKPDGSALQTAQSHKLSKAGYKQSPKSRPAVTVNIRTKRAQKGFWQVYYLSISATASSISTGEESSVLCISTYIDNGIVLISFIFHKNTDSLESIYIYIYILACHFMNYVSKLYD